MNEKTRFAIVSLASAAAGVAITALIDRFALKQDLEFLGVAQQYVAEGTEMLKEKFKKDDDTE